MKWILMGAMMVFGAVEASDWSRVEKEVQQMSAHKGDYASEKIKVVEVQSDQELGRLAALRFLEWVRGNPHGVAALPVGKRHTSFVENLTFLINHWNDPAVQQELKTYGLAGPLPEMNGIKLVQASEYYPAKGGSATIRYSLRRSYQDLLKIGNGNILVMNPADRGILKEKGAQAIFPDGKVDLTLLNREPEGAAEQVQKIALQQAQEYAAEYAEQIQAWGGIGFMIGSLQSEGLEATTGLKALTYTQKAEAAVELGGMRHVSDVALAVGLEELAPNRQAIVILTATGQNRAPLVKRAAEGEGASVLPVSGMQEFARVRIFAAAGAANALTERKLEDIETQKITATIVDEVIFDIALEHEKAIAALTADEIANDPRGAILVRRLKADPAELQGEALERLKAKIVSQKELPDGKRILHTGPHHDDVMLAYYGLLPNILGRNGNIFVYLTSGFNSVPDDYMTRILKRVVDTDFDPYDALEAPYALILARALRAARNNDREGQEMYEAIILLRHIGIVYNEKKLAGIRNRANWMLKQYFPRKMPGAKDIAQVQTLKGVMRESEEDRHMTVQGVPVRDVYHLRSGFYTRGGKPQEEDVGSFLKVLKGFKPHIVTVALDPEGTGPSTHHKTLQVVASALKGYHHDAKVWGYRNVWHRFTASEANIMFPVGEKQLQEQNECFANCYSTQKNAEFPPIEYQGTFSEYSAAIQREQFETLRLLLGREFFEEHESDEVRNAAGFVFMQELDKEALQI